MSTNLVRSLIAGSVSAVASLTLFAGASAVHAGGSTPVEPLPTVEGLNPSIFEMLATPSDHIEPADCHALDLANLEVRAAQPSPDVWEWRFWINGDTKYLCNDTMSTEMLDLDAPTAESRSFTLFDIVDANNLGDDYITSFATPCRYTTSVHLGPEFVMLDQYADVDNPSASCDKPAIEIPEPKHPDTPTDSVPTDSVPTGDQPGTPGRELPHTGNDNTTILVGLGLLVVGAGLGFTAMSMTRRRHA